MQTVVGQGQGSSLRLHG